MVYTFFAVLGLAWSFSILLRAVSFVRLYLFTPSNLHRYVYRSTIDESSSVPQTRKEPWAVVTGASDGIGRFLAAELAAAGLNVVLHGRTAAKLEKAQDQLTKTYPARSFRLLVADAGLVRGAADSTHGLGDDDDGAQVDFVDMIRNVLGDLHITVLVNNVGGGIKNPLMGDFLEYSARQNTEAVSKESLFAMHLTHTLLPQLRENGPGGALVVSVGSMADVGMPLTAVYSAGKAFNKTLFESLALEERMDRTGARKNGKDINNRGEVQIMYVRLGDVTDVTWRRGASSLLMPDACTAARAILARVGCRRSVVTAYWAHELLRLCSAALPIWLHERFLLAIMSGWREVTERNGGDASASIVGNGFF
ncbi:short chain dehydrogenase [Apiospora kogelbergensis]|uniref:Short chain dehydrogenase n=1 Tax=Apiospora kogelbergensis TaxID=1337665 RepID=A0AAW0R0I7_9PEZI